MAILCGLRLIIFVMAGHKQVALENSALRQPLAVMKRGAPPTQLRQRDRLFWILLMRIWKEWESALVLVQPDTAVGWQRNRFRRYWSRLSRPKAPGRPQISAELQTLVRQMAAANPLWGAPRIHGELLKLGVDVSERTVSRLMPKRNGAPSQTWRTFLANHVGHLVSIDFFTVATLQMRVLFVFVVVAHERRRVLHLNVTEHPTAEWTAQQMIEAFPEESPPRSLIRDQDGGVRWPFPRQDSGNEYQEVLTAPRSPVAKSFCGAVNWKYSPRMPQPRDRP